MQEKQITTQTTKTKVYLKRISIVLVPIFLALIYIAVIKIGEFSRYDEQLFATEYQSIYNSPGTVARALESAIRDGDAKLYNELTGLRFEDEVFSPKPNTVLTILMDVDEKNYFHYLYFDISTMLRNTQYIKEINGRWVASPQDAYFYFDSGEWVKVFVPLTIFWWAIMLVIGIGSVASKYAERSRVAMGF